MELTRIGTVESSCNLREDSLSIQEKESRIVICGAFVKGLYRLDESKHIQVLFGHGTSEEYGLQRMGDCGNRKGIFATRSPFRPSRVSLNTVRLLGVQGNSVRVTGLNAPSGCPVYDLMPFVPLLDTYASQEQRMGHLKCDPRREFTHAICKGDVALCLAKTAEIHGHFCPGSALGVLASVWGLRQVEVESLLLDGMESLMAVVETNACFSDGVQAVSGCTLGNNSLVYRDLGRHAVTFALRGEDTGVRIRVRPDFRARVDHAVPDFFPLLAKVIKKREGSPEEEAVFKERAREAAFVLIRLPFEELLIAETVRPDLPDYAPITDNALCPGCGEEVMGTELVSDGEGLPQCFMCTGKQYFQVEGKGVVERTVSTE